MTQFEVKITTDENGNKTATSTPREVPDVAAPIIVPIIVNAPSPTTLSPDDIDFDEVD